MSDSTAFHDPQPTAPAPPWLAGLNEAQRQAVECVDGPLLVLAGAGTGKTRVLTSRISYLLHTRRAWPSQILAVTFTNKAAREMQSRVASLVGPAGEGLWLGTFHAMAARILRRHAELVGLRQSFAILDDDDRMRIIKQLLEAENIDDKKWPARALAAAIDGWKHKGLAPAKLNEGDSGFANGRGVALYRLYQARLLALNACDFGDLLLHNLTLFAAHADVLADYQRRFHYVLVDEYQDSDMAQYLWLRLLAQAQRNICCVGDDDQSIYGWRGAEVGNILRFEQDFPGARIVRLERNYRSGAHILGAASGLIAKNHARLGKTLWTDRGGGEKVTLRAVWDGDDEARAIAEEIEARERAGDKMNGVAILVRAGHQTRAFEDRFIAVGRKYRVVGGLRFYERQEVRDAIAYLRLIRMGDDDLAFERIINVPKRGLGDATLQVLRGAARARGCSLMAAAELVVETDELKTSARTRLKALLADFARWRALAGAVTLAELAASVLDESGYLAMWQADRSPDAPGRVDNLKELNQALSTFESLETFLEHVSLVMDLERGEDQDMVSVMTLHAAKGLEFDTVFLPGWEEGLFPSQRSMDEGGASALEEERRLAHVGLTRARQRCAISFAASRRIFNQWQQAMPSRFIDELPAEHVIRLGATGLNPSALSPGMSDARHGTFEYAAPWLRAERRAVQSKPAMAKRPEPASPAGFSAGGRVFHQKFGYGRVLAVEGNKLTISFDKAGEKKVIDSFVTAA